MSDNPSQKVDVDALERELRRMHDARLAARKDPLAELARIVQHDDPFAVAGARMAQPAAAVQSAAAQTPAAGQKSAEQRLAEFRAMLDQRIPRPAAPPPVAPVSDIRVEPRFDPAPVQGSAADPIAFDLDEEEPRDIRLPPSRGEVLDRDQRRSSPFIRVALPVLALAIIGGGAYYAYASLTARPKAVETAAAPVIKAPAEPAKVAPPKQETADPIIQASKVLEPKAEDPKAPQSVVSTVEQPVDLKEAAPKATTPRVIPLGETQGAPVVVLPDPKPLPPAQPVAAAPAAQPAPAAPVANPPAAPAVIAPPPAEPVAAAPPPPEPAPAEVAAAPASQPEAAPQVAAVAPSAPEAAAPAVVAPLAPVSRSARMVAVVPPASLAVLPIEETVGPGIADKPRRVKSVSLKVEDPALTRSVRSSAAAASPAPVAQPAPEPIEAAPPAVEAASAPRNELPEPSPEASIAAAEAPPALAEPEAETPAPAPRTQPRRQRQAAAEAQPRRRANTDAPISLEPEQAPPPAAATGGGSFAVQFSAPVTQADANAEVARVRSRFAGALNGASPRIVRAEVNGRTVYRVRAGGLSRAAANQLCNEVKAQGGNCFVSNTN